MTDLTLKMQKFSDSWTYVLCPSDYSSCRARECTDAELATIGFQRIHSKQQLRVTTHRICTLPDGTEFNVDKILSIGNIITADPLEGFGLCGPSHVGMYVVTTENGKETYFHNDSMPRMELIRLWKDL